MITEPIIKEMHKAIIICLAILLCNGCIMQPQAIAFLNQYESEDFSQFNKASVFIRGVFEKNFVIFVDAPHLIRDSLNAGCYVVMLDRKSYQVIQSHWMTDFDVDADTLKLQQLAQALMKYGIPRLSVDEQENVFVYLKDVESLALVRFANEEEVEKMRIKYDAIEPHYWKRCWKKARGNWYRYKGS